MVLRLLKISRRLRNFVIAKYVLRSTSLGDEYLWREISICCIQCRGRLGRPGDGEAAVGSEVTHGYLSFR